MRIKVENFGPIVRADIDFKPLTVFVGPSNSGKSYMAILTYGLLKAFGGRRYMGRYGAPLWSGHLGSAQLALTRRWNVDAARDFVEWIDSIDASDKVIDHASLPDKSSAAIEQTVRKALQDIADDVHPELIRCFGTRMDKLIRNVSTQKALLISISSTNEDLTWTAETINGRLITKDSTFNPDAISYSGDMLIGMADAFQHEIVDAPRRNRRLAQRRARLRRVESELNTQAFIHLTREFRSLPYYLPAARSGVLQSHRVIASSMVQRAPFAGLEEFSIPTLSGVLTDFISYLLTLDTDGEMEFAWIAKSLEEEVLGGAIVVEHGSGEYPELVYTTDGGDYPIGAASSMVSELAPIVLFVRYLVEVGETLIIEEPESHLHPKMQRSMAGIVALLVTAGVRVIVTTHSDYFLDQLSNLISLSSLSVAQRKRFGYENNMMISSADVGFYLFEQSRRPKGSIVKQLKVTSDEGLTQADMDEVAESLYEEQTALRYALNGN